METKQDGKSRKPEVMARKITSSDCNNNKKSRLKIRQNYCWITISSMEDGNGGGGGEVTYCPKGEGDID